MQNFHVPYVTSTFKFRLAVLNCTFSSQNHVKNINCYLQQNAFCRPHVSKTSCMFSWSSLMLLCCCCQCLNQTPNQPLVCTQPLPLFCSLPFTKVCKKLIVLMLSYGQDRLTFYFTINFDADFTSLFMYLPMETAVR